MHTDAAGPGARPMTVAEGTAYFQQQALQTRKVAEMEDAARHAGPALHGLHLGKLEILRLRDQVKTARGAAMPLKSFHDDLLRCGRGPLSLIRAALLKTKSRAGRYEPKRSGSAFSPRTTGVARQRSFCAGTASRRLGRREQELDRDLAFHAGQRGPQAVVPALSERQVTIGIAPQIQDIGLTELAGIAVRRRQNSNQKLTPPNGCPVAPGPPWRSARSLSQRDCSSAAALRRRS